MRNRNRIADFYPQLWQKYLSDDLERQRQELKAATGIDPMDFVGNYCAREQAKEPQSFAAWSVENAVMGEKVAEEIVRQCEAREAKRRAQENKPPQS